jgi:uncharacterized protein (TIGR03437 family)
VGRPLPGFAFLSLALLLAPPSRAANGIPDLTIVKTHSGNFYQGQTGAIYNITVTNSGTGDTTAPVTVTDTLPTGLTATIPPAGAGWSCTETNSTVTCTNSDVVPSGGSSYPVLAISVNVATNAPASLINTATVSGGGEINTGNDTANDPTTVTPLLQITSGPYLNPAAAGTNWSTYLTASGGAGTYTWSASGLPTSPSAWLSLNASGFLQGTPPAAGSWSFTAMVTDGTQMASVLLTLPVANISDFVSAVEATNPLAYFRLESSAGTSENSNATYAYSPGGVVVSSPGAPIGLPCNNYALLNGTAGYINTTLVGNIGTAGSIMAWVNLSQLPSIAGHYFYIAGESQTGNDFDLQFTTDNFLRFYTTDNDVNLSYAPNASTLVGQWHLIIVTFDATAQTHAIYWDGALVASDAASSFTNKTTAFEIGASSVFSGRDFAGGIDEVAVWNYALTPSQAAAIFAARAPVEVLYWIDQDMGTDVTPGAITLAGLAGVPAGGSTGFGAKLNNGPWAAAIAGFQNASADHYGLVNGLTTYVDSSGKLIAADSTASGDSDFFSLMQAAVAGSNATSISNDGNLLFNGITGSIGLTNPGWPNSFDLTYTTSAGVGIGPSGSGYGIIKGNHGLTYLNGPLFDTYSQVTQGQQLVANELTALLAVGTQTITFGPLSSVALGSGTVTLTATASSGLTVSFISATPSVCTVSAPNMVTLVSTGNCVITALQTGSANYMGAAPVTQSFTVTLPSQTISFTGPGSTPFSAGTVNLNATASSGLTVSFTSNNTAVCTVSSNVVTLHTSGTCSITASQSGSGNYAPAAPVTVTFSVTAAPLTIITATLPDAAVGQSYGPVTIAATGGSGSYTWYLTGGPPGVTISSLGVVGSASPLTSAAAGSFPAVTVTVADTKLAIFTSSTFSISVFQPLSVTTPSLPNGTVGMTYGPVTMKASGGSGNYSWSVVGAPTGVTMSTAGVLTSAAVLTTAAAGPFSVIATVTDTTTNLTASKTFAIAVAYAQLTLSGPANLGGFAPAAAISASYPAAGGKSPYTWSATGLPAGLSLNSSTGALTGSITLPGNYSFQIQIADSQTVSATTSINVSLFVLGITTTSLPNGTLNLTYSQSLGVAGGSPPYTWSGGPVDGLSLSASGVLTGTPTSAGTFPVAVSVSSGGVTVSASLSIKVVTQPLPLNIPGGGGTAPVIVTGGTVGIPYSQTLQASNGKPPYSWAAIAGTLPNGLSLSSSGTLSGTPTLAGSFAFTGQVTDTSGASVSAAFSVTIAPIGLTITTGSTLPNGIVGTPYPSQIITAAGGTPPYTFQATGVPPGLSFSGGQISTNPYPSTNGTYTVSVTATDSTVPVPLTATASFSISISPAHTDLVLSQTAVGFALNAGATSSSEVAAVNVSSNGASQLNYSVTYSAPWLDVTGSGTTPGTTATTFGTIYLALDPSLFPAQAEALTTSVVVTCVSPSPCAGNSQTITVTLDVIAAPPQLGVTTNLLSFSAQTSNPVPASQTMGLENDGGGTITVNSITAADSFVTITGVPATIPAGPDIPVTVTADPTDLPAGYYQSTIFVSTSAGSISVPVTLFVAQNATWSLNPAGSQFQMQAGSAPGNPNGSFLVSVSGNSTVNWTATVLPGASWLTLNTTSGSSTSSNPGTVTFSVNSNAATLAAQAYYGTIQLASSELTGSTQSFLVVLNVAAAANAVQPDPVPAGLVFLSSTAGGSGALPPQNVQVFSSATTPTAYQATSDSSWLLVSVGTGSTSATSPDTSSVSVNLTGLTPGVYRGGVSYAFSGAAVRTVNVSLIVEAAGVLSSDRISAPTNPASANPKAACSSSQLVPTQTGLVNNFAQPTSWPTPLAVLLVDNCGNAVSNAQVVTTFSNGDPPLALNANGSAAGMYSGTWTPRSTSAQVSIVATANASGFPAAAAKIVGQVTPNAAPLLTPNGTLNVFSPTVGAPVAPGTIVQIYGSNLAGQPAQASTVPLPTNLNQTSVFIGDVLAPLYYVSPGQINAQVPFELPAGKTYQVYVSANGALSTATSIQLVADAPGIAQFPAGQVIATHADGSLILETSPAAPGEYIVLYVVGMGLTNQNVASGSASPLPPDLALPVDTPTLTLNGATVTNILFAGLTPTEVGLYQINFQVPSNEPNGDQQLVLTQPSGQSNTTILPVHN